MLAWWTYVRCLVHKKDIYKAQNCDILIQVFRCSHLITYLQDETPEVRQAAAYGVGVMATCAKDTYAAAIRGT